MGIHKAFGSKGSGGGGGAFSKVREMIAKKKAEKAAAQGAGQAEGVAEAGGEASMMAEASAGGGGGVEQHGPESHTGGAGPQGGGGGLAGMVKKSRPIGGGMGNLFSDIRLKENISKTGISKSGIPIYEFNYIGGTNRYSGAMAQDLLAMNSNSVTLDDSGYYKVNYDNIDVDMHLIN